MYTFPLKMIFFLVWVGLPILVIGGLGASVAVVVATIAYFSLSRKGESEILLLNPSWVLLFSSFSSRILVVGPWLLGFMKQVMVEL